MALFGNVSNIKPKKVVSRGERKAKQPSLREMAEERFGDDRNLMMWIDGFLDAKREVHQYPSRTAWATQLTLLEEWPEEERIKQIQRSIACDYRAMVYKYTGIKKNKDAISEVQNEEEIIYDKGY